MDELLWLRMFGGGFGSGVDLAAVLAFVAFGVVAFLAPVVGYRPGRSAGITASLYLLAAYVGVSAVQLVVWWARLLDDAGVGRNRPDEPGGIHLLIAFALVKMLLFLAAMLCFAVGLRSLRVRGPDFDDD